MTDIKEILQEIVNKIGDEMQCGVDTVNDFGMECAFEAYWTGFDACLKMVLNHLDNCDEVTGFRNCLKENILEEAELCKKDG